MVDTGSKWEDELGRWFKPFLDRLGHKARWRMYLLYVSGLIGPGDRKSVQSIQDQLLQRQVRHSLAQPVVLFFSSSLRRFTWSPFKPPNSLRHRQYVNCVTPIERAVSPPDLPCESKTSTLAQLRDYLFRLVLLLGHFQCPP
ncbi:hypothetical protein GGQ85_003574 [Nitrobacter vulgaris]|nr:hypothetical protein [Nitrobacter vulgaris]